MSKSPPSISRRPRYMMAMVLGTALSAFGSSAPAAPAIQDISRYCTACWRNARLHPDCWTDCTQEVFCRLLERVTPDSWEQVLSEEGAERRELIRAIDMVKKRVQRARKISSSSLEQVADRHDNHEQQLADERETLRQASAEVLSDRQQRIIEWTCAGWSVQEIARELRLPPERISDEKYKAIHRLRDYLAKDLS